MTEVMSTLFTVSVLIFVLSSLVGLGLNLTFKQVFTPLKKVSLIAKALVASFILTPLIAYALARVINLDEQLAIGLFILGVSAGSPLLAKFSQIAKGDLAYTLGLMVPLQVVTILFAPLVLLILLEDIQVDSWGMLQSLVTTMLITVQNFAEPKALLMVLTGAA
jgi:BASS family bile acid:Na+ symporter